MSRTLYISDLDGTLLDPQAQLPTRAAEIIDSLSRRGALITVATARTPATVVPMLEGVHLSLPAIVMTGAAMFDLNSHTYLNTHPLDISQVEIVERVCARHHITPFIYTLSHTTGMIDAYHSAPTLTHAERTFVEQRNHLRLKKFHLADDGWHQAIESSHGDSCVILAFAMGRLPNAERAAADLREHLDCAVTCYQDTYLPNTGLIDIFRPGVTKAAAVRQMKEIARADRVVVFGDNLNDLSMMAEADLSVAVANAVDEVRTKADIVIGANTDIAVPRFIAYDFDHST